jgi:predicted outer membrane lipoprotein
MTWVLTALVIAAAAGVLLAILMEGTNARNRSRGL